MTSSPARVRAVVPLVLVGLLLLGLQAPAEAARYSSPNERELARFMHGLSCQESGGRYHIMNPHSKAYGRYQIMPRNWPNWARRYIGDAHARQTARNQELVARAKFRGLYRWLGAWDRVAHWWLTGSSNPDRDAWSASGKRYTGNVMYMYRNGASRWCSPPIDVDESRPGGQPGSGGPPAATPPPADAREVRVAIGSLNFRTGPHWTEQRIGWVLPGTRLVVLDQDQDTKERTWYRVRLPNRQVGWLAGWYTRAD